MLRHTMRLPLGLFFLVVLIAQFSIAPVSADVVPVGDVVPPNLSDAGGDVGGDLIIGNSDVGGLFVDIAPPLSGTLEPLLSVNGILGNGVNAIGAAVFDDFGVSWRIEETLVVGLEGQGFIDVFQSANLSVGYDPNTGAIADGITILGDEPTGQGTITLNDRGTRLVTSELTVGNFGMGVLEMTDGGSVISEESFIALEDGSIGQVTVTGLGSRWDLRDVLEIGNDISGAGTLRVTDRGVVQLNEDASILVNQRGVIELAGGVVRNLNTTTSLSNEGVIRGDGNVQSDVINTLTGELRNASAEILEDNGDIRLRERLLVTGAFTNSGIVESLGGEMEFDGLFTNNADGDIIARDAVLRFDGDLNNFGEFAIGGESTIYTSNLFNSGELIFLPDSEAVLRGNLVAAPFSSIALTAGPSAGTLDIIGTASLDGFMFLDYSGGIHSSPGDTYTVLTASGGITGTFVNTQAAADGRLWTINYLGDAITVTAAGLAVPMGADFDGDGFVTSADIAIWDENYGSSGPPGSLDALGDADGDGDVDGDDFLEIQIDFGMPPTPLVGAVTVVPEPSSLLLALSALAFYRHRRRS